jgi:hypothetical protein
MQRRRSELQQPVAGLFSTPREERQKRAIPALRAIRAKLLKGWCEGALARDRGGYPVTLADDRKVATAWSLYGAAKFLPLSRYSIPDVEYALSELRRAAFPRSLQQVNDFGGRADCLVVIDRALHACGAEHRGGWKVTNHTEAAMPMHRETRAPQRAASSAPAATPPGARRLAS